MTIQRPSSILITGASSGIGEALAHRYAASGVFLALSGRDETRLDRVAGRCRNLGALVERKALDVTDQPAMEAWIQSLDCRHPLELVFANAGVSTDTSGLPETADRAQRVLDINIRGVINTVLPVLPYMVERRAGQIALMSSLAGFRGLPSAPAYSASKAWVRSYAEGLRGRYATVGIDINVICPGFVQSRITDHNTYRMPFLMNAPKAAHIIEQGLIRNKPRIAFPFPMHAVVWLIQAMPPSWSDRFLSDLPLKE